MPHVLVVLYSKLGHILERQKMGRPVGDGLKFCHFTIEQKGFYKNWLKYNWIILWLLYFWTYIFLVFLIGTTNLFCLQKISRKQVQIKVLWTKIKMSYTELESGYQGLQNRPGFYVGDDGNLLLDRVSFLN